MSGHFASRFLLQASLRLDTGQAQALAEQPPSRPPTSLAFYPEENEVSMSVFQAFPLRNLN